MRQAYIARCALGVALCCTSFAVTAAGQYTDDFPDDRCDFRPYGGNAYFSLQPGRQAHLSNERCLGRGDCDELEEVWITVTDRTRRIDLQDDGRTQTVVTRVIQEFETIDGELEEISYNYYATCVPDRDVYYFGERVDIYEDGRVVGHEGQWLAGRQGAEPGIIMPDPAFLLGSRYMQEIAPGVAMDRAEHVALDLDVRVPAGSFDDCVRVRETTPLEPGSVSIKVYCPGVGLVRDGDLELIAIYENAVPPAP